MIEPDVIPGRMALLVTLFLVVINIFNNLISNSPNSVGFTAISAWIFSCLVFVFGTLVAYAGILMKKKIAKKVNRTKFCVIKKLTMIIYNINQIL